MNDDWKKFLGANGAIIEDESVVRFGQIRAEIKAASDQNIIADLSHYSLVRAQGEDAASFLLGQFTNDIRQVDETRSQLSAYCTPKGRMLAIFRIFRHEGVYVLQLPTVLRDPVLARLRMYVLRAKVTLEPVDDELVHIGVSGPEMKALLANIPETVDGCLVHDGFTIIRLPGIHPRFEVVGAAAAVEKHWRQLQADVQMVGAAAWSWLDIMAGLPTVLPLTSEAFIPQMVNLDLLGGVNFKKGCYPGQEIVARMQYLGKLKQRMYRARVDTDTPPQPGDSVYAPNFGDQSAGTVVDAQPDPGDGYDLLAVIQIAGAEAGDVRLAALDGPRLELKGLPYDIPAAG